MLKAFIIFMTFLVILKSGKLVCRASDEDDVGLALSSIFYGGVGFWGLYLLTTIGE